MEPEKVVSPANKIKNLSIIHNDHNGWSVAEMEWRDDVRDGEDWRNAIGIRWNGDGGSLGHPQSSGHATWFMLPEGLISEVVRVCALSLAQQNGQK